MTKAVFVKDNNDTSHLDNLVSFNLVNINLIMLYLKFLKICINFRIKTFFYFNKIKFVLRFKL